jgi:hypothetical protein
MNAALEARRKCTVPSCNENVTLIQQLKERSFGMDFILHSDKKTKFYTGLPSFAMFLTLVSHVYPRVKLYLLAKLRLNLGMTDLGYHFSAWTSTISRVFHSWLTVMHDVVGSFVMWPKTDFMELPECFRNRYFEKTGVIIHCTGAEAIRSATLCA